MGVNESMWSLFLLRWYTTMQMHDDLLMGFWTILWVCKIAHLKTTQEGVWAIVQKCTNFKFKMYQTPTRGRFCQISVFFIDTTSRGLQAFLLSKLGPSSVHSTAGWIRFWDQIGRWGLGSMFYLRPFLTKMSTYFRSTTSSLFQRFTHPRARGVIFLDPIH